MLKIQKMSASAIANAPAIGRKTKGGFEMTSKPFNVAGAGVELSVARGLDDGEGDGDSVGVGEGDGDVGGALMVKKAQGFGATLAQSLCWPGESPAKVLTRVLKFPPLSAVAAPATLFGLSQ
jgi:hypothetical protein